MLDDRDGKPKLILSAPLHFSRSSFLFTHSCAEFQLAKDSGFLLQGSLSQPSSSCGTMLRMSLLSKFAMRLEVQHRMRSVDANTPRLKTPYYQTAFPKDNGSGLYSNQPDSERHRHQLSAQPTSSSRAAVRLSEARQFLLGTFGTHGAISLPKVLAADPLAQERACRLAPRQALCPEPLFGWLW